MTRVNQRGSHILGLVLFVAVLAVVGLVGYKVTQVNRKPAASTSTASATITSKADLAQVARSLDSSSAQVNNNLDDSGLNADLDSML